MGQRDGRRRAGDGGGPPRAGGGGTHTPRPHPAPTPHPARPHARSTTTPPPPTTPTAAHAPATTPRSTPPPTAARAAPPRPPLPPRPPRPPRHRTTSSAPCSALQTPSSEGVQWERVHGRYAAHEETARDALQRAMLLRSHGRVTRSWNPSTSLQNPSTLGMRAASSRALPPSSSKASPHTTLPPHTSHLPHTRPAHTHPTLGTTTRRRRTRPFASR